MLRVDELFARCTLVLIGRDTQDRTHACQNFLAVRIFDADSLGQLTPGLAEFLHALGVQSRRRDPEVGHAGLGALGQIDVPDHAVTRPLALGRRRPAEQDAALIALGEFARLGVGRKDFLGRAERAGVLAEFVGQPLGQRHGRRTRRAGIQHRRHIRDRPAAGALAPVKVKRLDTEWTRCACLHAVDLGIARRVGDLGHRAGADHADIARIKTDRNTRNDVDTPIVSAGRVEQHLGLLRCIDFEDLTCRAGQNIDPWRVDTQRAGRSEVTDRHNARERFDQQRTKSRELLVLGHAEIARRADGE